MSSHLKTSTQDLLSLSGLSPATKGVVHGTKCNGKGENATVQIGIRIWDPWISSRVLYQLSYLATARRSNPADRYTTTGIMKGRTPPPLHFCYLLYIIHKWNISTPARLFRGPHMRPSYQSQVHKGYLNYDKINNLSRNGATLMIGYTNNYNTLLRKISYL
jgi:hypothetical protein